MVVRKSTESLRVTALRCKPTRGLGGEPDENDLENRRKTLKEGRNTPSPRRLNLESAVGCPGGDDRTRVPERVVKGSERGTVWRVCDLRDQHGGGVGSEGQTEADEETVHPRLLTARKEHSRLRTEQQ